MKFGHFTAKQQQKTGTCYTGLEACSLTSPLFCTKVIKVEEECPCSQSFWVFLHQSALFLIVVKLTGSRNHKCWLLIHMRVYY